MIKISRIKRTFPPNSNSKPLSRWLNTSAMPKKLLWQLELNPDPLRKWIPLYKQELQGIELVGNAITPGQRDIQQLKAQIKRLEMEKEILKQATVLMSEITGKLSC